MARSRTKSQRTAAKKKALGVSLEIIQHLQEGDFVKVTRFFRDKEPVVYSALVRYRDDGKVDLEPVSLKQYAKLRNGASYNATFPMLEYADWFIISAIPVLINRFTRLRNNTRSLMTRAAYSE